MVLVDFDGSPLRIIAASATAFEPDLKRRIAGILDSADSVALDELGQIDVQLAQAFARAALALLRDAGGAWASTGRCDDTLLQELLDEPYLSLAPPKSTGRELFNMPWLNSKLGLFSRRPEDVQATLRQFTAVTVVAAIRKHAPAAALYVCGGGAHNTGLLESIAQHVAPNPVATIARLGLDPDYVEAVAFAWFARRTLEGLTSSAGSVTGAAGARILGGVYRYA